MSLLQKSRQTDRPVIQKMENPYPLPSEYLPVSRMNENAIDFVKSVEKFINVTKSHIAT